MREWSSKATGRSAGRTSPRQASSAPLDIEERLCYRHGATDWHRRGSWMRRPFDLLERFGDEFSEMPGRGEPMFVDVRGAAFAHRILALINWNSLLTVGVAQ